MSNKKLRERKKHAKKERAKKVVAIRRKKLREVAKESKNLELMKKRFGEIVAPIRNDMTPEESKKDLIKKRLERNQKILEAMQAEMEDDQELPEVEIHMASEKEMDAIEQEPPN